MTTQRFAAITIAATACAAGLAACAQGEPRFGVCRQEIRDYVEQRLGHTITRLELQSYAEYTPPQSLFDSGSALVYVKECKGFHGFEIRATEGVCEHIPHYGTSSGSYIRYQGPFEDCRAG